MADGRPLAPCCALKVAVVGNRRFAGESDEAPNDAAARMKAQASAACAAVWQVVVEAIGAALETSVGTPKAPHGRLHDFFSREKPCLTVLSSLAAGGDQIGALTALGAGRADAGVSVLLEAVLPFSAEDYPGLPGKPRPEFRLGEAQTLIDVARQARQVVRLDGRYGDDGGRQRAYEQAREMVLQHADMVVATTTRRPGAAARARSKRCR